MPTNKDFKRLVRARMKKTGEAYTTARTRLLNKPKIKRAATRRVSRKATVAKLAAAGIDYAALAGMRDDVIKAKTGCTWEKWVKALDYHGAEKMSHREIAELAKKTYKAGDWWSQTVAVGYERIKGLRAVGQRRDGTYEASKSRTFDVPVNTLFEAWADDVTRRRWLDGAEVKIRTATAPKSMRIDWIDKSIIAVGFTRKGTSKSAVAIQHTKLPDPETAKELKDYWDTRLDALGEVLGSGST
jgi:hypothetical protein